MVSEGAEQRSYVSGDSFAQEAKIPSTNHSSSVGE